MTGPIPILLLKTRSQPEDKYYDYFSSTPSDTSFVPYFAPVLEHRQDQSSMKRLAELLRTGNLKKEYGGMIFTSQRAVEAWSDVVKSLEHEGHSDNMRSESRSELGTDELRREDDIEQYFRFPIYTVGPATSSALNILLESCQAVPYSPFASLHTTVHGAHTGNGASLAEYILEHYNILHAQKWFTYYEAARLPFIPLLGPGNTYSRRRLDPDDPRLQKKPLLFVTGETRRDIIPTTLMSEDHQGKKIMVEELEVYGTEVMASFRQDFEKLVTDLQQQAEKDPGSTGIAVVVVFSPQGAEDMLKVLGYLDEKNPSTEVAKNRLVADGQTKGQLRYIIATIGPTTKDFLKDKLGFEADICAKTPSPEGLGDGINNFLTHNYENIEQRSVV